MFRRRLLLFGLLGCMVVGGTVVALQGNMGILGSDSDLLPLVKAGTRTAESAIKSGKGCITARQWRLTPKGAVTETNTITEVVFRGQQFKLSLTQTMLVNTPGEKEDASLLIAPGNVSHYEIAFDGTMVTVYYPDENAANIFPSRSPAGQDPEFWGVISPRACGFCGIAPAEGAATAHLEKVDGANRVVVDWRSALAVKNGEQHITTTWRGYFDPDKCFAPYKIRVYSSDGVTFKDPVLVSESDLDVRDYGPSVCGPAKYTNAQYGPDKDNHIRKVTSTRVEYAPTFQFNVPVSDSDLEIKLPSGTNVKDAALDANYVMP